MKKLLLFISALMLIGAASAQDSIWIENFTYPNGTTVAPGPTYWTLTNTSKANVQDSTLRFFNYGTTWTSEWIKIDSFYNVNWYFYVGGTSSNSLDNYSFSVKNADGTVDELDSGNGAVSQNNVSGVLSGLEGDSIQLIVYADPRVRTYVFDSISLVGTKKTSFPNVTINIKDDLGTNLNAIKFDIQGLGTYTTDASGNAIIQMDAPLDRLINISYEADGYKTLQSTIKLNPTTPDTTFNFAIEQAYDVTFNLIDGSAAPISNALISLNGYGDSLSDGSGTVVYSDVANSDSIAYTVTASGFDVYSDSIKVADAAVIENIQLIAAYNVNVVVVEEDGTPIDSAFVELGGIGSATSDYTGKVTFLKVLPSDSIYYTVSAPFFNNSSDSLKVVDGPISDTIVLSKENIFVWYESLNQPDGAVVDSGDTKWNLVNYTLSDISGGTFVGKDKGVEWISEKIAIDSLNGNPIDFVKLSMDIKNSGHAADSFTVSISIDNGAPNKIFDNGSTITTTLEETGISGDTLQIFVYSWSNVSGRLKTFNNVRIQVETSAPVSTITPAAGSSKIALDTVIVIAFDQAVRNIDDSPISNPASIITLKETDASGANVPFNASINASSDSIIITPSSSLANGQTYYVTLADVENIWGLAYPFTPATFTTIISAPALISTSPADSEIDVAVDLGTITIKYDKPITNNNIAGITIDNGLNITGRSVADSTITLNVDVMASLTQYTVSIPDNAIVNTDGVGNTATSFSFTSISTVGIAANTSNDSKIYPIPAKDILNIEAEIGSTIKIIDILGNVLDENIVNNSTTKINVSEYSGSVIILKVNNETTKVIVE